MVRSRRSATRAPAVGRGQRTLLALGCVALTACYSGGGGSLRPTATIYSGGGVSGLTPASQWVEVRLPVARAVPLARQRRQIVEQDARALGIKPFGLGPVIRSQP